MLSLIWLYRRPPLAPWPMDWGTVDQRYGENMGHGTVMFNGYYHEPVINFSSEFTSVRSITEQIQLVIVHDRFGTVGCL
jgi:hypothetical protein